MGFGLSLRIAQKLPLMVVGAALVVGVGIGLANFSIGSGALGSLVDRQIQASAADKARELSNLLTAIEQDVVSTAISNITATTAIEYMVSWGQISAGGASTVLRNAYVVNNPGGPGNLAALDTSGSGLGYDRTHQRVHPGFRQQMQLRGYEDIYLFDIHGNLVYSVNKGPEFATSFVDGPYAASGLGQAWQAANAAEAPGEAFFADFSAYGAREGAPAAFVASPIFDDRGRKMGVFAVQIAVAALTEAVNTRDALGRTGEAVIVGADGLLRSNSTFTEDNDILAASIDGAVVSQALGGAPAYGEITGYRDMTALAAAHPVAFGGADWVVVALQDRNEAGAPIAAMGTSSLIVGLALLALAGGAGYLFSRTITRPLSGLTRTMEALAQGDLDVTVSGKQHSDEIGAMARAVEVFRANAAKVRAFELDAERQLAIAADNTGQIAAIHKSQAVIAFTPTGEILDANENFLSVMGYRREEIMGRHHSMFVEPGFAGTAAYSDFWASLREGQYQADEFLRLGKDGSEVWIQASYNPILDPHGNVTKIVKFATDITGRKRAINHLSAGLYKLAEGDLDAEVTEPLEGEFETLRAALNQTISRLRDITQRLRATSRSVKQATAELLSGANDLSERTTRQAASIEETAAAMEELARTVTANAERADIASGKARAVSRTASEGGEVMAKANAAMERITTSSSKVSDIIKMIDDIAFQTNLLALNASVEAARAGEAGKGFAVVAVEVRRLAQSAALASGEVKALIEQSANEVDGGSKLVAEAAAKLKSMLGAVTENSTLMDEIALASREQASAIEEVSGSVKLMDEMTQHNSALVEETNATIEQTEAQASELDRIVEVFKMAEPAIVSHPRRVA